MPCMRINDELCSWNLLHQLPTPARWHQMIIAPIHHQHWHLQLMQSIPRIARIVFTPIAAIGSELAFGTNVFIEELEQSRFACDSALLDPIPVCLCGLAADGVV